MSSILIYSIGFLSQLLFSARTLIQWLMSEKQHRVVSPSLFWILSLIGSVLLFCYGWLRNDFSIMLGQSLTYYIYIWNLKSKGVWQHVFSPVRWITLLLPPISIACLLAFNTDIYTRLFDNKDVPLGLLIYG
ncbi:MAG: lipid-A-disaccharide synthase N-terminal domain-containing protein, partial [Bacteroidaceae bacterium]